jgi:ATP-dependent Zn protease
MDVKMATDIAVDMVTKYGMSPMGMFNLQALTAAGLVSDEFKARVLAEVQKLLDAGKAKAFEVIEGNLDQLKQLIAEVDEHETLLEPDLKRIFNLTYGEAGAEPIALPAPADNK